MQGAGTCSICNMQRHRVQCAMRSQRGALHTHTLPTAHSAHCMLRVLPTTSGNMGGAALSRVFTGPNTVVEFNSSSRSCSAVVSFDNRADAIKAVEEMNGNQLDSDGYVLRVQLGGVFRPRICYAGASVVGSVHLHSGFLGGEIDEVTLDHPGRFRLLGLRSWQPVDACVQALATRQCTNHVTQGNSGTPQSFHTSPGRARPRPKNGSVTQIGHAKSCSVLLGIKGFRKAGHEVHSVQSEAKKKKQRLSFVAAEQRA